MYTTAAMQFAQPYASTFASHAYLQSELVTHGCLDSAQPNGTSSHQYRSFGSRGLSRIKENLKKHQWVLVQPGAYLLKLRTNRLISAIDVQCSRLPIKAVHSQ